MCPGRTRSTLLQNAGIELRTFTPGATTSGLMRKSTSVGPWLEKPAMMFDVRRREVRQPEPIVVAGRWRP